MRLMTMAKRGLALLGLAAAAGCITADAKPASQVRPALWRVSDPDTSIYLFGTFHLLPSGYRWETPAISDAVAKSGQLYVETLIDDKHPEKLAAELGRLGYSDGLPPLANRIDPALRPQLAAAIKASGIPAGYFDKMKTWAAAFTLVGTQFRSLGLKGEAGVEPALRQEFETAGKPVGELETNSEQLGFFNTLSLPAQRAFLEGAISAPEKVRGEFAEMLASWSRGDVAGIARSFNSDLADSPELKAALLARRNANWTRWIEQRMQQPGTLMVAVGAGHLAGDESVINMLQTQGYKVTRIQ
ncbi:MAG: TraB/GumN family protein [Sphingomicrobium sp.]